jgi:hypothetical protein
MTQGSEDPTSSRGQLEFESAQVEGPGQGGGEQGAAEQPNLDGLLQRIGIYGGSGGFPCP